MPRPLKNRLSVRLGAGLCLAAAAILIAAGVWNLRLQRVHLTRLVETNAIARVDDIRRSTREAMLRNSPDEVSRIIESIATQPAVTRIRIFDKQGRIWRSTDRSDSGIRVDKDAELCVSCHRQDQALESLEPQDRVRIFTSEGRGRFLEVIAPIHNEASCAGGGCHASSSSLALLGVLDLELSLSEVDRSLAASERQMFFALLGTAVALLASAWFLIWRLVLRPVARLTRAATSVAAGDLSTHIAIQSDDEIAEMTEAWNHMIARLGRAQIVLEQWGHTLEQKVEEKTAELEEAHRQMLLVEKMASLGKLAAVVAHEINNPLTGIGTYARLLRRRLARAKSGTGGEPDETADILRLIEEEAGRCGGIVRSLLLFGRTPAAAFASERLGPLLDRCALLLRPQAESCEVTLDIEAPPDLPSIECDASQIQQLILALGLNAIEAASPGGRAKILARRAAAGEQIVLLVHDTGRGIPPEHLDKIFEPFFTTKQEGRGLGLGLAVAYGIARRHQGSIEVDSSPDSGTTFTIRLPCRQPAGQDSRAEKVSP